MEQVNYLFVFIEGILAFLSPCILPLIPIYIGILARQGQNEEKGVLIKHTLMFILGISTTFFILGASMSVLNQVIYRYKGWILIVGGAIVIIMGLFYMDYIHIKWFQKERRFRTNVESMSPWTAYALGFTFSFGWTPCIGPMLASVMLMAAGSESALVGNVLIGLYSLGFMVPFLMISLFYSKLATKLDWLKRHMGIIQKVGGVLLIIIGMGMIYNGVIQKTRMDVLPKTTGPVINRDDKSQPDNESKESDEKVILAPDFTLTDQYGNTHTLSDYKGKTVFLNFWATWCGPCKVEMPHIEAIYNEYGKNSEDVIILGVAMPELGSELTKEGIISFLEEEGYTFPVVFDEEMTAVAQYAISAFPTTFMINPDGSVKGYVPGAMEKEVMIQIIEDTRNQVEK